MRELIEVMHLQPSVLQAALLEPVAERDKFCGRTTHELGDDQQAAARMRAQSILYIQDGVPCLGWHFFDGVRPIASARALLESHELLLGEYQAQQAEEEEAVELEADREAIEATVQAATTAASMVTIVTVKSLDVPGISEPVAEALVPGALARALAEQKIEKLQAKLAGLEAGVSDHDELSGLCEALQTNKHMRIHYGLYIASFLMGSHHEFRMRLNRDPLVNGFFTHPDEAARLQAFAQEEVQASGTGKHSSDWMFN